MPYNLRRPNGAIIGSSDVYEDIMYLDAAKTYIEIAGMYAHQTIYHNVVAVTNSNAELKIRNKSLLFVGNSDLFIDFIEPSVEVPVVNISFTGNSTVTVERRAKCYIKSAILVNTINISSLRDPIEVIYNFRTITVTNCNFINLGLTPRYSKILILNKYFGGIKVLRLPRGNLFFGDRHYRIHIRRELSYAGRSVNRRFFILPRPMRHRISYRIF